MSREDTAADRTAPVVSFVAFSGTGKTTYLEKLIAELKCRGVRVAVVKHDGHDFELDRKGKDTERFTRVGADVTAIVSGTHAAIMENRPVSGEELVSRIRDVDLILTEGFKHESWPKILLYREELGKGLPLEPNTCLAVVTDDEIETSVPCFHFSEIREMADFLLES